MTGFSASVTFPAIWRLLSESLSNAGLASVGASYATSSCPLTTFVTKCRARCSPLAAKVAYAEAMSTGVICVSPPPSEMLLSLVEMIDWPPSSLVVTPASCAACLTGPCFVSLRTMS